MKVRPTSRYTPAATSLLADYAEIRLKPQPGKHTQLASGIHPNSIYCVCFNDSYIVHGHIRVLVNTIGLNLIALVAKKSKCSLIILGSFRLQTFKANHGCVAIKTI